MSVYSIGHGFHLVILRQKDLKHHVQQGTSLFGCLLNYWDENL